MTKTVAPTFNDGSKNFSAINSVAFDLSGLTPFLNCDTLYLEMKPMEMDFSSICKNMRDVGLTDMEMDILLGDFVKRVQGQVMAKVFAERIK